MTDLHVNVGEWRMQPVEFNLQRMFVSGRLYRYAYGDEIEEVFEPVAIGLTNGQAAVLVAWKYGPVPRIL